MSKFLLSLFAIFMISSISIAQIPKKPNATEIYESIEKLNFLGSVLYVAAHPDDENTNLISYFANDVHARTAYIAITRGDGGQNLIGPELREELGVIRTQELLQARKIDGGIQFFTRANDFGFSKNPDETFNFWSKNDVLSDLVFVIRKFRPDIIINRFDTRTPGTTHGHHTASALLSTEAFDLAGQSSKFPNQLKLVNTWQPKRLFFNDSWFFYKSVEDFEKADHSSMFKMNIGSYYPSLGLSNSEIAAKSRSQHRSQGFGTTAVRGNSVEYLEPLKGGMPKKSLFEGIDTSWKRLKNGGKIETILSNVQKNFDFKNPSASIPELLKAYRLINQLEDEHWKNIKLNEIKDIIIACSGLFLENITQNPSAAAGEFIKTNAEATNRSEVSITLKSIDLNDKNYPINKKLENNTLNKIDLEFQISQNQKPTTPYWLEDQGSLGMYKVSNPEFIGLPEAPVPFISSFNLEINGENISINRPLVYKYNNPAKGEVYQPFIITPKASVNIDNQVVVLSNKTTKKIEVSVKSFLPTLEGDLNLIAPRGWVINPVNQKIKIDKKGENKKYSFELTPPENDAQGSLIPQLKIGDETLSNSLITIDYEHIPQQNILVSGAAKLVHLDLIKKGNKIGYINGAGDSVAENLREIGYDVDMINLKNTNIEDLSKYDAVVLGVRAFNVLPELKYKNTVLFDYVKNGGNLIVQYNVSRGLVTEEIAPFPLTLSANRVTDENAKVDFIDKNSLILTQPNLITEKDFDGWVQERGLYFPNKWDKNFVKVLSMHDKGEAALDSSLLYAKYGKGYYIYTGLSFFRELPAGVPGAYRLFVNLISLGKK